MNRKYSLDNEDFTLLQSYLGGETFSSLVLSVSIPDTPKIEVYHLKHTTLCLMDKKLDIFARNEITIRETASYLEEVCGIKLKDK